MSESFALADPLRQLDPRFDAGTDGCLSGKPTLGIVLGSGLGGLADQIEDAVVIPFSDVDGIPTSTAIGHRGQFILGQLAGMPTIAMAGRLHSYEGHDLPTITRPLAVMRDAGVTHLVVSCAAGGLNPRFAAGDVAVLDERMSWLGGAMGRPVGLQRINDAFPPVPLPVEKTVDTKMLGMAENVAHRDGFRLHRATYLAVNGPNYETRAECRMMRTLGVDVVGMSTVPELIAAHALGMAVLPIAVVTNMAIPDCPVTADHADVLEVSNHAGEKLQSIVVHMAATLAGEAEENAT
ncbi:MAG: purine-nucleoside phosphorylase [Planctomycetota bacterium]